TARKAVDLKQHENRQKRGGGIVHVGFAGPDADSGEGSAVADVVGREPTPEFAAQVAEECQRLLAGLPDDDLRQLALWKMEGYTNEEIAQRLDCVPRTIERKLRLIRSLLWSQGEET